MRTGIIRSLAAICMVLSAGTGFGKSVDSWQDRIIYFALIDRFENGRGENDKAYGDPECNKATDPHAYQGGDLEGVRQRLPDIEALGANALWLTPLYKGVATKAGQNCGFPGYWAAFAEPYALELDPRFGTASEFDDVLSEARSRDIRTILDMVVNHSGYGAPLVSQRPDWFHDPKTCGSLGLPEIFCPLAGLPDFNHRIPAAASYLLDIHKQWTQRFDIDGIRMDTVKHVEPWYFREWINGVRRAKDDLFVFGELLDEGSFGGFQPYLDTGFDGLFNFPLRRALIDTFAKGASVDVAASRVREMLGLFGQQQSRWLVTLLDNHDVPRFMEEFPTHLSAQVVHERYKLALTALLTLPGIPQLTYGNEVGMYGGADPDNRRMMPQWAFSPSFNEPDHEGFVTKPGQVWSYLQRLIAVRKEHQALSRGDFDEIWRQSNAESPNVWAFVRSINVQLNPDRAGSAAPILVIFNNGNESSGLLRLPLRGHFGDGVRLSSIPLESDTATGKLMPDKRNYRVQNGGIELEIPGRSVLLLTSGDLRP